MCTELKVVEVPAGDEMARMDSEIRRQRDEIERLQSALVHAEATMSIIPPYTMQAHYMETLKLVRAALGRRSDS